MNKLLESKILNVLTFVRLICIIICWEETDIYED